MVSSRDRLGWLGALVRLLAGVEATKPQMTLLGVVRHYTSMVGN